MSSAAETPDASVQRLSRYHCFLGEMAHSEDSRRVTSREIAEQLGVSEETVRRDLSYVSVEGRPGAGYDSVALYEALGSFLGLSSPHPFVAVGNRGMLDALSVVFPAEEFGLVPVAYFSDDEEDAGGSVGGIGIRGLEELPALAPDLGAAVALVACKAASVPRALDLLEAAGVQAVLMLTPMLRPQHRDGMNITYFRIPCALKSLASGARQSATCCAKPCSSDECVEAGG